MNKLFKPTLADLRDIIAMSVPEKSVILLEDNGGREGSEFYHWIITSTVAFDLDAAPSSGRQGPVPLQGDAAIVSLRTQLPDLPLGHQTGSWRVSWESNGANLNATRIATSSGDEFLIVERMVFNV